MSVPLQTDRTRRAGVCGLAAALLALVLPVVAGWAEPGYSHVAQFISELGAAGAVHARLVGAAGFAPIGVLALAFLGLARPALPRMRQVTIGLSSLAALCVGLGFVAMLLPGLTPLRGLSQRVAEAAIFLWIAAVSWCCCAAGSGSPAPARRGPTNQST